MVQIYDFNSKFEFQCLFFNNIKLKLKFATKYNF